MRKAFTLIELLIVISIIGVLTTMILVSFGPAQKQARDTARKSDLRSYQTALENYANKSSAGLFPEGEGVEASSLCETLGISGTCPSDAKEDRGYIYYSDGTDYVLSAELENITGYWVVCSTGKTGIWATAPSSEVCPI